MLDFFSSVQKKWITGIVVILFGVSKISFLSGYIPGFVTPLLGVLPYAAVIGGIWVLMEETK